MPLVVAYDALERTWLPPMPLLFQRRFGAEHRPIEPQAIRHLLIEAGGEPGSPTPSGRSLRFAPHDFRRLFITDAIMHGMPPHIAQLVAGHRTSTSPWDTRRSTPKKSSTATGPSSPGAGPCVRATSTAPRPTRSGTSSSATSSAARFRSGLRALLRQPCIHEHSCIRCPLLRPDPAQRSRLEGIEVNLGARIAEASREGWPARPKASRSAWPAREKLAQMDQMPAAPPVYLGMPGFAYRAAHAR